MRAPETEVPVPRRRRGRRLPRWSLPERRGALVVAGVVVAGWLAFVFAGTLGRADDLEAQAQAARAQVRALEDRLALGRAEVDFVSSDAFVEQSARSLGWGAEGEVAFALPEDAPPPPPVPILGAEPEPGLDEGPLGSLLRLVTGS